MPGLECARRPFRDIQFLRNHGRVGSPVKPGIALDCRKTDAICRLDNGDIKGKDTLDAMDEGFGVTRLFSVMMTLFIGPAIFLVGAVLIMSTRTI